MSDIKLTTIFSRIPLIALRAAEKDSEKKKLSYWLEKLHIQREEAKKENAKQIKQEENNMILNKEDGDKVDIDTGLTQSGINEHTKNIATKEEDDIQTVNDLVKKSNRRIISISSQFPWDFFPNTIEVEESRVTFKFSQLFSFQSHSVSMKDISNVFIESSMFFASLQVVSRTYIQNDIKIGNLDKTKAKKVQSIIEGLRTFAEHNINTSDYEIDELIAKIGEFHTNPIS